MNRGHGFLFDPDQTGSVAPPSAPVGGSPTPTPSVPPASDPRVNLSADQKIRIAGLKEGEFLEPTYGDMAQAYRTQRQLEAEFGGPLSPDVIKQTKLYKDTLTGTNPQSFKDLVNSILPDAPKAPLVVQQPWEAALKAQEEQILALRNQLAEVAPITQQISQQAQTYQVKGWLDSQKTNFPILSKNAEKSASVVAQTFETLKTQTRASAKQAGYTDQQISMELGKPENQTKLLEKAAGLVEANLKDVLSVYAPQGQSIFSRTLVNDQKGNGPPDAGTNLPKFVWDASRGHFVAREMLGASTNGANGSPLSSLPTTPVPMGGAPSSVNGPTKGPVTEDGYRQRMGERLQALRMLG